MTRVNIPGVGVVNFPDTMKPEEITHAIETDILPKAKGAAAPPAQAPEEPGMLATGAKAVLAPVTAVVDALDQFTGVPIRAGISKIQDRQADRGEDPNVLERYSRFLPGQIKPGSFNKFNPVDDVKDLAAGVGAAVKNFGGRFQRFSDPNVPEAKDIAARGGVPLTALSEKIPGIYSETGEGAKLKKGGFFDPTAAGMAGLGIDLATPVPGVGEIKGFGRLAGGVAKVVGEEGAKAAGKVAKGAAKAVDVATGTKAATKTLEGTAAAIKTTGDAVKSVGKSIAKKYEGKYSPEYTGKHTATIEKNGIDPKLIPNSVKFGENSQASKFQRYEAEFLRPELADAHDAGLKQVQAAVRADIEKIGSRQSKVPGGVKIPQDANEAGEIILSGFNRKVDEFFDKADVRYQTIAKEYPNIKLPMGARQRLEANLTKQEAKAQKLLKTSTNSGEKAQLREFLDALQTVRANSGTYSDFVSSMQSVGRTSFKNIPAGNVVPPDKALFKSLYHDLSGVAMETVSRQVGKKTAKELAENNKAISEFINDKGILSVLADPKKGPDKAFQALIESGDVFKAKALKRALNKEEIQAVKAGWLNQQIRSIEAADGEFTFRMLNNRLRNPRAQRVIGAFFDKGELDNLKNLVDLGDQFGPKVLSTSGTGAVNTINGIVEKVTTPVKAVAAGANKALAVRQEKAAAKAFAEEQASKQGKRIVKGAPGMNAVSSAVPENVSKLLRLKPRLRVQEAAYKNLNEDEK